MSFSRGGAEARRFGSRRGAENAEKVRAKARFHSSAAESEGLLTQPSETSLRPLRLCAKLLLFFVPSRLRTNKTSAPPRLRVNQIRATR